MDPSECAYRTRLAPTKWLRGHLSSIRDQIEGVGFLLREQQALFSTGKAHDISVYKREHPLCEFDLRNRQRFLCRWNLEMRHPQHSTHLRWISEVRQCAEINRAFGLRGAFPVEEALISARDSSPGHGMSTVRCRVLELNGDRVSTVFKGTTPGTVAGEESRGYEIPYTSAWDPVGAGGSE